jgi:hypothetical protein
MSCGSAEPHPAREVDRPIRLRKVPMFKIYVPTSTKTNKDARKNTNATCSHDIAESSAIPRTVGSMPFLSAQLANSTRLRCVATLTTNRVLWATYSTFPDAFQVDVSVSSLNLNTPALVSRCRRKLLSSGTVSYVRTCHPVAKSFAGGRYQLFEWAGMGSTWPG